MTHRFLFRCLLLFAPVAAAHALEVCDLPPRHGIGETAKRIIGVACNEHRLWHRAFIDANGRIAHLAVTEAENDSLADDGLPAWQRVATYWREGGTLSAMAAFPGAPACAAAPGDRTTDNDCRAFLLDNPWSAAFVSWVMSRAEVPDFARSPRHIDYIRAAHAGGDGARPYRLTDPATAKPEPGDLLCYLREPGRATSHAGLLQALEHDGAERWKSHCDVVVAGNVGGDRTLYLVGGNVANTVMMRKLPLDRTGRLILPPAVAVPAETQSPGVEAGCSPGREQACDVNRRDWAALLKLVEGTAVVEPGSPQP